MATNRRIRRRGLTLLELVLVLIILAALAAMVIPLLVGLEEIETPDGVKSPERIATEATLTKVRDVILGSNGRPGVWSDLGQRPECFPRSIRDLFSETPPVYLPAVLQQFDPASQLGWRGPYLTQATGKDASGLPTLIDAWGRPLVLQLDFDGNGQVDSSEARYARLVSAGPDGELDTPANLQNMVPGAVPATQLTLADCDDDVVLFFRVADTRQ